MRPKSYEQDFQIFTDTLRKNLQSEGVSFNLAFNGGSDNRTLMTEEYAGPVDKPEPENEPADLENEPAGPVDEPEPVDEPAGPVDEPKTEDESARRGGSPRGSGCGPTANGHSNKEPEEQQVESSSDGGAGDRKPYIAS
jgi:hypothetical protein